MGATKAPEATRSGSVRAGIIEQRLEANQLDVRTRPPAGGARGCRAAPVDAEIHQTRPGSPRFVFRMRDGGVRGTKGCQEAEKGIQSEAWPPPGLREHPYSHVAGSRVRWGPETRPSKPEMSILAEEMMVKKREKKGKGDCDPVRKHC